MEIKEVVIKSQLYPFVLRVVGSEDDIECFESIIADSSDMAGLCITFSDSCNDVPSDPTVYKLEGKTIFEWRRENKALAAQVRDVEAYYDKVIAENHTLTLRLVKALKAKPPYADLIKQVVDLEGYLKGIKEIVDEAIVRDRSKHANRS